jgi:hypothetical protein
MKVNFSQIEKEWKGECEGFSEGGNKCENENENERSTWEDCRNPSIPETMHTSSYPPNCPAPPLCCWK